MSRTFALLLAFAILVAHMLAIHKDAADAFAPPYEMAHVAYRLARNFVHNGEFAWDPGESNVESYPSLLWVALSTIPERLYLRVTACTQFVSLSCALVTAGMLARFSPERLAGVIAPLLFVASGTVAAGAASGTEMTLAALLLTGSFLAYERGSRGWLATLLGLLCLARPEGFLFACSLLLIELARAARARASGRERRALFAPFLAPAAVALCVCLVRFALTEHLLSPWSKHLTHPDRLPWRAALAYLRDYFVSSGSALLIVFPLWYLARRTLSGLGQRALLLTLAWGAITTLGGSGPQPLPFSQFMLPILAVLFVAVQEAMTHALDSKRTWLPPLTWTLFALGMAVSALASKFPGDLGPLRTEHLQRAWMRPHTPPRFGYSDQLGRTGLDEEIENTERLRGLGVFLRDHLDPAHSVLTPWPGAIGYLSRLRVIDAMSRVTPMPGMLRARGWNALERCDIVAALSQRADYIVPTLGSGTHAPSTEEIVLAWIEQLDHDPESPERRARIVKQMSEYELITVPGASADSRPLRTGDRYYLLRHRDLQLSPQLSVVHEGRSFVISVQHRSHQQLVDLCVQLEDEAGELWSLRPSGEFERRPNLTARRGLLLYPTGSRSIELVRGELPADVRAVRLLASLRNPGARGGLGIDAASPELIIGLR